jgi:hypothetical protein
MRRFILGDKLEALAIIEGLDHEKVMFVPSKWPLLSSHLLTICERTSLKFLLFWGYWLFSLMRYLLEVKCGCFFADFWMELLQLGFIFMVSW